MSVRGGLVRAAAVVGLALAQLRRSPGRTALTVVAVALAVLSVTLLASLGVGVVAVGEDGLDDTDRDLWITDDPDRSTAGSSENAIADASEVAGSLNTRDDVRTASPIALHEVYIGSGEDAQRWSAVGVHETHGGFDFEDGGGFELDPVDYAEAPREEPASGEIVLDPRIASELDVSVGDSVQVGSSKQTTGDHEFTVVGISAHHSGYLGSPAVTMPIVDLQLLAGTSGTDRATFIMADTTDDADSAAVRDELQQEYPEYSVQTSDEQVEALVTDRPIVIASGMTLVGLAVVGSGVLIVNLFVLVAYQQRDELAALRAIGLSRRLLAGTIAVQGFIVGILGGVVGVAATPLLVDGLNRLARSVVGFEELLVTSTAVYAAGFALALCVGTAVAAVTGWRAGRHARLDHLGV